ncbi:MAG: type II toxin-antitoxin system RelE/ParE family toxin [Flavobacteriales bacterium]
MVEPTRSFRITLRAKADLIAIGRYTERAWGKRQRDKYLTELDACFKLLARNAKLGRPRPEIQEGYYSFSQGSHVIFYIIAEKHIDIIGIPHKSMDIPNFF